MDYIDVHELYHYGVPGMKWGHHKTPEATVSNGNRRKNGQQTEDKKKEKKPFLYNRAVKTSKQLEKFSERIPGIRKIAYTKELSKDQHATRGYAFMATVLAAGIATKVTIGAIRKHNGITPITPLETKKNGTVVDAVLKDIPKKSKA